jgi:hypothetical protein
MPRKQGVITNILGTVQERKILVIVWFDIFEVDFVIWDSVIS